MVKLKEYAAQAGVSYETIREQAMHTYKKQLGKHLIREHGAHYLDDEGVAILDDIRQKTSPRATIQAQRREIQALQERNRFLEKQVLALQTTFFETRKLDEYTKALRNFVSSEVKAEAGQIMAMTTRKDGMHRRIFLYDTAIYPTPAAVRAQYGEPTPNTVLKNNKDWVQGPVSAIDGSYWFCIIESVPDEQLQDAG